MSTIWEDEERISPEQLHALMKAMGIENQRKFAQVFGISQPYLNRVLKGEQEVRNGPLQVLIRWLLAEFGIDGGRPPVPSIPVRRR